MTLLEWSIDGLFSLTLIWLAWQLLTSPDLFRAIVLFISFGLIMALVWVRLAAFDIALAEAIIGAGISGTALLVALRRVGEYPSRQRNPDSHNGSQP